MADETTTGAGTLTDARAEAAETRLALRHVRDARDRLPFPVGPAFAASCAEETKLIRKLEALGIEP